MVDYKRIENTLISTYWCFLFYTEEETPRDLISALTLKIPHISALEWSERIAWGGAYVNGILAQTNVLLPLPCKLEYYEPKFDFRKASDFFPQFNPRSVFYDDGSLLGVYKPKGLPSMPAKEQIHFNLKTYVEKHLGRTVHLPSRLDMSAHGLVVMSGAQDFHNALQQLYVTGDIEKIYLLCVAGNPAWEETVVEKALDRDSRHPVLRTVVEEGGQAALTSFRVRERKNLDGESFAILEARPKTGRTHQIRVHAASIGFPIVGDNFYGGVTADELHLMSFESKFIHPKTGEAMALKVPEEFWPKWVRNHNS